MQNRSGKSNRNRASSSLVKNGYVVRPEDLPPRKDVLPKKNADEERNVGGGQKTSRDTEIVGKKEKEVGRTGKEAAMGNEKSDDIPSVEIDYDQNDEDSYRGFPVAYHYRNQLFTRGAIRDRIQHHTERYKHYPPMLRKQFQSDLTHVFNEEYPFIRDNIRPVYGGTRSRNHYATQRSKKGEKRRPNCYTLFCNDVKASFSASYIQRKGIHNLWRQVSEQRKQQYRAKAREQASNESGRAKHEEDQEARWNSGQYVGGPKLPPRGSAIKLNGTDPNNHTPPNTDEDTEMSDESSSNDDESVDSNDSPAIVIPPKRRYDSDSSSSSSDSD